jgi:manganese/zinc/iron transport system permease protein
MDIDWDSLWRALSFSDFNTRVVVTGTALLGLASGIIGSFLFLRKRALMGDAASHATLPGIAIAFLLMVQFGGDGKYFPGLLLGGFIAGLVGVGFILFIRHTSRIKEDAALGIVLSVFFGLGMALNSVAQHTATGNAAGLSSFIYGNTASMLVSDAMLIGGIALLVALICGLVFKELSILCFDQDFAGAQGWPVLGLDALIMGLSVVVIIIGLQAVGLILMVALLIIPPAAARFWTHYLKRMVLISALIGAFSGLAGALISAMAPNLPAGAIIVLVASSIFMVSLLFGREGGAVHRFIGQRRLEKQIAREHLLRALYEWADQDRGPGMTMERVLKARAWRAGDLQRVLRSAESGELIFIDSEGRVQLTRLGNTEAHRLVRNHRLWELYLVNYAAIAPSHVDRTADQLEHVLAPTMVEELEGLLAESYPDLVMPDSPHQLELPGNGGHQG